MKKRGMNMKKLFVLLLVLLLVFSAAACGGDFDDTPIDNGYAEHGVTENGAEDDTPSFDYAAELPVPYFTHTTDDIGFVLDGGWSMDPGQDAGAVFIIGTDAGGAAMVNVLGPHDVDPAWEEPAEQLHAVFGAMLEQSYDAQNLVIETLSAGELGHAVLRADYIITAGDQSFPGIAFVVTNGSEFVFVQGTLTTESIAESYLEFVASIRFLN